MNLVNLREGQHALAIEDDGVVTATDCLNWLILLQSRNSCFG
ncbi:hypothetical protein MARPU_05720 [Marichromatium purpuratum 984]|uniref:Uncharacterized protein n=1 Tax=Marichromatium purpuratum 984 TaxID=765910 RepID=W0E7B9_MARPU|nr:hypothetical protein MARPU_05720 [Marichromatium purpuratum 984]